MTPLAPPLAQFVSQFGGAGKVLLWLGVIAVSAAGGAWVADAIADAEIAQLHADVLRQQASQAEHASRRLLESQQRGDALTIQLETANRAAVRQQENLDDALRRATTGSACLRERALRLLDDAPGITVGVPAPARSADAADGPAAAAADERVSSDTDVTLWISRAGRQYDECRRRLGALIDWYAVAP